MTMAETLPALRSPRVLIASSREAFRRQWIEHPPYGAAELGEAAGGADALAKLESEEWGEVLLDSRLHDLGVSEVVRLIRLRHPNLLVRVVDSECAAENSRDLQAVGCEVGAVP